MLPIKVHFPLWLRTGLVRFLTWLSHLKVLWSIWDLRTLILLSLGLQIILIFVAPFRKRTANSLIVTTVWLAYLLADYIAIQAVGLIPNYSVRSATNSINVAGYVTHPDLLAFWAPFLLVHLGGPDPITALALEDNELWMRTALHFLAYFSSTARVFFQSLPTNILFIPTVLMLFAGFFKYLERTLSMYYARLGQVRASMQQDWDPADNYVMMLKRFHSNSSEVLPPRSPKPDNFISAESRIDIAPEDHQGERERLMSNVKLVRDAFQFFDKFKGLYVDLSLNNRDWNNSRNYFLDPSLTPEQAFMVLETELNFTYEVFFTKMIVIHQKFGITIRCASFTFEVVSLVIWILFIDKQPFHRFDIWITYTLVMGAVVIDSIAFLMVALSDWQVAMLSKKSTIRASLYDKLLSARSRTWGISWRHEDSSLWQWIRRAFFRRWSDSVYQFNVMDNYISWLPNCVSFLPPIKEKCERFRHVSNKWFANELRDYIFEELKYRARFAKDTKDVEKLCDSKGDWVIASLAGLDFDWSFLNKWITEFEFDQCLMIWHLATEILYQEDDGAKFEEIEITPQKECHKFIDHHKYCRTLSNYMMYLLNWQPGMMSSVVGINIETNFRDICSTLQDTSTEATLFFRRELPDPTKDKNKKNRLMKACRRLMNVETEALPRNLEVNRSSSALFDAVCLAKELKAAERGSETTGMWEVMAKVWLEMLCYSATHCRPSAHAAQLKQGGELLTLVWLLMAHLGLSKQFRRHR